MQRGEYTHAYTHKYKHTHTHTQTHTRTHARTHTHIRIHTFSLLAPLCLPGVGIVGAGAAASGRTI